MIQIMLIGNVTNILMTTNKGVIQGAGQPSGHNTMPAETISTICKILFNIPEQSIRAPEFSKKESCLQLIIIVAGGGVVSNPLTT